MGGGWPAFVLSLMVIGGMTAVIEQLGGLLGCVVNLNTQVTRLSAGSKMNAGKYWGMPAIAQVRREIDICNRDCNVSAGAYREIAAEAQQNRLKADC